MSLYLSWMHLLWAICVSYCHVAYVFVQVINTNIEQAHPQDIWLGTFTKVDTE